MKARFVFDQLRFLFQTLGERRGLRKKCAVLYEAALLVRRCRRLGRAMREPVGTLSTAGKSCTVILLSHNRPHNLHLLVDSALRNECVSKVIVSNSNRKVRIGEWVKSTDPRVSLVDETEPTQPGYRFVIAARDGGEYFISIDDDIFLTPRQIGLLFEQLVRDHSVPHGVKGNLYEPSWEQLCSLDREVDVLLGVYAFTRRHVSTTTALAEALGLSPLSNLRNGEDILMSFAGPSRPRIHAVGRVTECASNSLAGIALWKTVDHFFEDRRRLFERARETRRRTTTAVADDTATRGELADAHA
jgi:hypothetical protein